MPVWIEWSEPKYTRQICSMVMQLSGKDQIFESPSAFSIALKRLVNPLRKADDGWKTVKYNGKFLDNYKLELARRRLAGQAESCHQSLMDCKHSAALTRSYCISPNGFYS